MQGYDYLYLYETKNVTLECAGSDQWGNITTGVDLIQKKLGKQVNAFTMPLILDSNGNKFGKSEGNALWLDLNKTSSYEIYQYLINSDDTKVEEYLKVFTFLSKEEIEDIMKKHNEQPELRIAQKALAKEFITDLHGSEEYEKALKMSEVLFSGNLEGLSKEEIEICFKGVPNFEIEDGITLIDMLTNNGICTSRREAREFLGSNAISLNGRIVTDENLIVDKNLAIDGEIIIIRRGKKKYYLGRIKSN